jgi:serine protease Do
VRQRDHEAVKSAFRSVVTNARQYTVRVFAGADQVAMGTVVDSDGLILTKASELNGSVTVRLADGRRLPATIVSHRDEFDLALLRVDATGLSQVDWAVGDGPEVGNWLATPGQDEIPASIGVLSGAARRITEPRPMLGVILDERDPRVVQVLEGSGAERAGLKSNDVITQVNGKAIDTMQTLVSTLERHRVGERIELLVKRGDEELKLTATLTDRAAGPRAERSDMQNSLGGKLSDRRSGFPLVLPHDTVLRPNECGGPLVNLDGTTVGINIARAGRVASYALPASVVMPVIAEMKAALTTETQAVTAK